MKNYNDKKAGGKFRKSGLGFVEVLIAISIISACAIPIVYMVTSSRTDTSKAINYLRAMELANEAIDWAMVTPFERLDDGIFSGVGGTLVRDSSGNLEPEFVQVGVPSNPIWVNDWTDRGIMGDKIKYSEQYNKAFFWREIKIENVTGNYFQPNLLKKVIVTVKWSEGKRPANVNIGDDRMRQVQLSVLLLNDKSYCTPLTN